MATCGKRDRYRTAPVPAATVARTKSNSQNPCISGEVTPPEGAEPVNALRQCVPTPRHCPPARRRKIVEARFVAAQGRRYRQAVNTAKPAMYAVQLESALDTSPATRSPDVIAAKAAEVAALMRFDDASRPMSL